MTWALKRGLARIAVTLVPLLLALAHVGGLWHWSAFERLDKFIYDVRLRATMPQTSDRRVVIVDIDEASLQVYGQWPWARSRLAQLVDEIMGRQRAAAMGFDVVFAEPDTHTDGAKEHDARFARAMTGRPVALGYYFTNRPGAPTTGVLPAPVLPQGAFPADRDYTTNWNGYGANIPALTRAAAGGGFINAVTDSDDDGVLRAVPLIARLNAPADASAYYESLGLAVYRLAKGKPPVAPVFAPDPPGLRRAPDLHALAIGDAQGQRLRVPVDAQARILVPFRGPGGADGGSFRYVSAARVLSGRLAPGELRGAIVLVGTTAPGLQDMRPTPVSAAFPGVEIHANVISALLDGRILAVPDYAAGYDFIVLLAAGLLLAVGMSLIPAPFALLLALFTAGVVAALNTWLYLSAGLVLPVAVALTMIVATVVVNMSWGNFIEARTRRNLMRLFGSYVPPKLVEHMLERPRDYGMRAKSQELTVMFCDIRGFTEMAERMAPTDLQMLLNSIFDCLTEVIGRHGGTVDKYMGDCVMAFWGAPVAVPMHATQAVRAACEMIHALAQFNATSPAAEGRRIEVGIGLNTGLMSVGDMGSALRRSYTVIGDAVNLAARLEGLGRDYGVTIVASAATCEQVPEMVWQELDRVQVRGKAQAVTIFTPVARVDELTGEQRAKLDQWQLVLSAYYAQQPEIAARHLAPLLADDAENILFRLYAKRIGIIESGNVAEPQP